MKPNWIIRKAIEADSDNLKSCMISAYSQFLDKKIDIHLPPLKIDYLYEIKNYPVWVVESEKTLIGGLIMQFDNESASIANIAIDPTCQGQGIGSALISFAQQQAKAKGYSTLKLTTHILLDENISLYQYLGWIETRRNQDKVFMSKTI